MLTDIFQSRPSAFQVPSNASRPVLGGGRLALCWNMPATFERGFHRDVQEAYAAHWPDYRGDPEDVETRIAKMVEEIGDPRVLRFPWSRRFDAPTYLRLMTTWSDHRALSDEHRLPLQEHVARIIGDGAVVDYEAVLFLA